MMSVKNFFVILRLFFGFQALLGLEFVLLFHMAWAEDQEKTEEVEKIEVTGSRLKRINIEGPAPVLVLDREDLDRLSYSSVSDVLRSLPMSSFGGRREAAGNNKSGLSRFNLRGLGSGGTLILLNGIRVQFDKSSFDANSISMAAVERIEILKGGASSIYGGDAVGGVINIITKKAYKGFHIQVQQSFTEKKGGAKGNVDFSAGFRGNRSSLLSILSYRQNEEILMNDRSWPKKRKNEFGYPGSYLAAELKSAREIQKEKLNLCSDSDPDKLLECQIKNGHFKEVKGALWNSENCPAHLLLEDKKGNRICQGDFSKIAWVYPKSSQFAFLTEIQHQLYEDLDLTALFLMNLREVRWIYAGSSFKSFVKNNPEWDLPNLPSGTRVLKIYFRSTGLGPRINDELYNNYTATFKLKHNLNDWVDIELESGNFVNLFRSEGRNYVHIQRWNNALGASKNSFNPFGPIESKDVPDSGVFRADRIHEDWRMISHSVESRLVANEFWNPFGYGPIGALIGAGVFNTFYVSELDDASREKKIKGSAGGELSGRRSVLYTYTEGVLPLFLNGELQLSTRFDRYNDAGPSLTGKAAIKFNPWPWLLFRSSVGNSFIPPSMQSLRPDTSTSHESFIDSLYCKTHKEEKLCKEGKQYEVVTTSNPNLKPEKSLDFNVGAYVQPPTFFGMTSGFGLDFWGTSISNLPIDLPTILDLESNLGREKLREQYKADISRLDDGEGTIDKIKRITVSKSKLQAYGLDFNFDFSFYIRSLKVRYGLDHGHMLSYKEGVSGDLEETIGTLFGGAEARPAWKQSQSLNLTLQPFSVFLITRFISGFKQETIEYPIYNEWDLQLVYNSKKWGDFAFGVTNVFEEKPPELGHHSYIMRLYEGGTFGRAYYFRYALSL